MNNHFNYKRRQVCVMVRCAVVLLATVRVPYGKPETITLFFKDSALVSDTVVTVQDIAIVNGNNSNIVDKIRRCRVGLSAPPGYSRFISTGKVIRHVLEMSFETCRFISHGPERISVSTQAEEYTIATFQDSVCSYIQKKIQWDKKCWSVKINNADETFLCGIGPFSMKFEGIKNGYPKGNTVLKMILIQGGRKYQIPVFCKFTIRVPVVVCTEDIPRKSSLTHSNCILRMMDITRFGPTPFYDYNQLNGKRTSRTIKAGTIIHDRLVKAIPLVVKDDEVEIAVKRGRIQLSVPGIARESGGLGERIWVKNKKSKKLIRAQIENKGRVTVAQRGRSL